MIVLNAAAPSLTGTTIWKLGQDYPSALWNGVFTVRGNEGMPTRTKGSALTQCACLLPISSPRKPRSSWKTPETERTLTLGAVGRLPCSLTTGRLSTDAML